MVATTGQVMATARRVVATTGQVMATARRVVATARRVVATAGRRAAWPGAGAAHLNRVDEAPLAPARADEPAGVVRWTLRAGRRRDANRSADSWSHLAKRQACGWCNSSEPPPRGTPRNRPRLPGLCHSWDNDE